jgi:glutamate--cysteine ligase
MDLDPYLPLGMDIHAATFIETFLLWCLLSDSPLTDEEEYAQLARNQESVVERGRDPHLLLSDGCDMRSLPSWASALMGEMMCCARLLDQAYGVESYSHSMAMQQDKLQDGSLTASARLLADMRTQNKSFAQFVNEISLQHAAYYADHSLTEEQQHYFVEAAQLSLQKQCELESVVPAISFEEYLAAYYGQYDAV